MVGDAPRLRHADVKDVLASAIRYADKISDAASPIYQLIINCVRVVESQGGSTTEAAAVEINELGVAATEAFNQRN